MKTDFDRWLDSDSPSARLARTMIESIGEPGLAKALAELSYAEGVVFAASRALKTALKTISPPQSELS